LAKTKFKKLQHRVLAIFASETCQKFFALLIFAVIPSCFAILGSCPAQSARLATQNFIANLAAAQFNSRLRNSDDTLTDLGMLFEQLNFAFSAVFLIEIGVNLFANWFRRFFRDTWNVIDAVCVLLSLAAIGQSNWTALRFMRTVRVVRLFGKFKEMRRMLRSLAACVTQMGCTFFILMVLASICEALFSCIFPIGRNR
jgi:hypothetical protein